MGVEKVCFLPLEEQVKKNLPSNPNGPGWFNSFLDLIVDVGFKLVFQKQTASGDKSMFKCHQSCINLYIETCF